MLRNGDSEVMGEEIPNPLFPRDLEEIERNCDSAKELMRKILCDAKVRKEREGDGEAILRALAEVDILLELMSAERLMAKFLTEKIESNEKITYSFSIDNSPEKNKLDSIVDDVLERLLSQKEILSVQISGKKAMVRLESDEEFSVSVEIPDGSEEIKLIFIPGKTSVSSISNFAKVFLGVLNEILPLGSEATANIDGLCDWLRERKERGNLK